MSKMQYFSNKFSKIAKRWRLHLATLNLRYWWPEVAWFNFMVFQTDYDKIKL